LQPKEKKKQKKKLDTLFPSISTNYFDKKCQLSVAGMIHIQKEEEEEVHLQLYKELWCVRLFPTWLRFCLSYGLVVAYSYLLETLNFKTLQISQVSHILFFIKEKD
jgi:hypothetical protein